MNEAFCMYFDHNYLPQAIVTLRTLHRHDPDIKVFVLALSTHCEKVLGELSLPNVAGIIPLDELERFYPGLARVKSERRTIEYYFTLTPFLPDYLFRATRCERITHIDADLCFYASTAPLRASSGQASVAIVSNRFSAPYAEATIYGSYNVGWITYTRTPEGERCLTDYKAECLDWCYDRVEGDRYADQKYLDRWPDRYQDLHVIRDKGVDLAIWNADNYEISETASGVMIDDQPLVFYHFSGAKFDGSGALSVEMPPRHARLNGVFARRIAGPYIRALTRERWRLLRQFPFLADLMRSDLRFGLSSDGREAPTHTIEPLSAAWELPDDPDGAPHCEADDQLSVSLLGGRKPFLIAMILTREADRVAWLRQMDALNDLLKACEAESAARLHEIQSLAERLRLSEADRAARLKVIHALETKRAAVGPRVARRARRLIAGALAKLRT